MTYELLKWLHILSAFLLFGTGLGSAFYKFMADRKGDIGAMGLTNRHVVMADWLFTVPTVVIQPASGWLLLRELDISLLEPWVATSFGLYFLAGACWLPVVWLQLRMRDMTDAALLANTPLPGLYRRYARIWFWLGWPAFIALVIVIWLMVAKPALW